MRIFLAKRARTLQDGSVEILGSLKQDMSPLLVMAVLWIAVGDALPYDWVRLAFLGCLAFLAVLFALVTRQVNFDVTARQMTVRDGIRLPRGRLLDPKSWSAPFASLDAIGTLGVLPGEPPSALVLTARTAGEDRYLISVDHCWENRDLVERLSAIVSSSGSGGG